ncbi:MAG: aminodeoxychorismate lyase [Lachnospiraceae bacterium]|nr:aminodeoxychorismate lyase [Lachnospiraceae bacterium]
MKSESLIGAVIGAILKIVVAVAAVYLIYTGAMTCYDYGYRIFTEPAVSSGTGRTVTVTVTEDMSPSDIGELFYSRGLTRDAKLFALQYIFSEYRDDVTFGTFELNTAMTAEEMMEAMTSDTEEDTD